MEVPSQIIEAINKYDSFIGHTHLGPDPDSVGSSLALKIGLESIGKVVYLFCEDDLPRMTSFLSGVDEIEVTGIDNALTRKFDAYLCVDTAKWGLVTHREPLVKPRGPIINIDHHPDNSVKAQVSWINPEASSASEMVYHVLKSLNIEITAEIATCLACGILYDTEVFQNTNTTPAVLRLIADLQDIGANYNRCLVEITRSYQMEELKVWALLLQNLKISPDASFVWTTIDAEEWSAFPAKSNVGNFADALVRRVDGTDFGAVLVEKKAGLTKGSIRARLSDVDISQIAHELNGGGHLAAAGFRLEKSLKLAEADFLRVIANLKSNNKI